MPFLLTRTVRWVGSFLTLFVGGAAAYFVAQADPVASLGLGLMLAVLVFLALTLAARADGVGGLSGYRLIAFVLVLAVLMVALGVMFWVQPGMRYGGVLAAVMFTSAAFYLAAALHALARMRKDRAGP
jgi:hypothetical protein